MLHNEEWGDPSSKRHKLRPDGSVSESSSWGSNWRWMIAVGVFIIQLMIPTVFSAYGVVLAHILRNEEISQLIWRGLLPPTLYITTRSFIDPICSNIFSGQSLKVKAIAFAGALMMAGSIAANLLTNSEYFQFFTVGILGGLSASVVVTQAEAVLQCHYPSHQGLIQVLNNFAHALGHFGIPLLVNGLILKYGTFGCILLYSGTVLHGLIGATILSPPRDNVEMSPNLNRPRTFTVDDCVELTEFPSGFNIRSDDSPLLARDRSWKNPATASESRYDIPQTSSPVISLRHKKINGVDILPKIPEESEEISDDSDSDSDSDRNSDSDCFRNDVFRANKKVTTLFSFHEDTFHKNENLGNDFNENEDLSPTSLQKWRNTNLQIEPFGERNHRNFYESREQASNYTEYPEDIKMFTSLTNDQVRFQRCDSGCSLSFFQKVKYFLLCRCCNKHCYYDSYIWIINLPNNVQFYMIEPLINAFKVPYFFPAVLFYSVSRFNLLLFVTFLPHLLKLKTKTSSPQEGALAISVAAFCWLIFLLFSPCLIQSRENTKKTIYFVGSFVLAAGLYIISTTRNHSYFVLGSALFGMGHGATVGTIMYVLEEELGIRDFVKVQGPLSVISGCFVLFTSVLLGIILQEDTGIQKCFLTLSVLQLATNILLILSFFKTRLIHVRNISTTEWHPAGDFLSPG